MERIILNGLFLFITFSFVVLNSCDLLVLCANKKFDKFCKIRVKSEEVKIDKLLSKLVDFWRTKSDCV